MSRLDTEIRILYTRNSSTVRRCQLRLSDYKFANDETHDGVQAFQLDLDLYNEYFEYTSCDYTSGSRGGERTRRAPPP